jgi:hypothetical protein
MDGSPDQKKKEYNKKYYEANKLRILAQNAGYREANRASIQAQRRQYRAQPRVQAHVAVKNRQYLPQKKQKIKDRRLVDENFRLAEVIRSKVHKLLRGMTTSYKELLGMDLDGFRDWLSFQFEPGMTWDNYGREWQIDHVLPMSRFDLSDPKHRAICYGWTNLQPLWTADNRLKSNRIVPHYFFNSFVTAHRFIQNRGLHRSEYQRLRESVAWLRATISGMVKSSLDDELPESSEMGNPQPSS